MIQTLLAIVDAQFDYASLDPMKTGVAVYARRLLSSPGKKDGLYWEAKPGEPESPLGPLVAKAQPGDREGEGYYGYHYRLLYGQGPDAPGGAYSYLVQRPHDRRLRRHRLAGEVWRDRRDDASSSTRTATSTSRISGRIRRSRPRPSRVFNPDKDWQKADTTPP